jgi:ABC-type antimicrobial peptide transport system permease subunit
VEVRALSSAPTDSAQNQLVFYPVSHGGPCRRALALTAGGLIAGLFGTSWLGRYLTALLLEVTPTDPLTLAAVAGILLAVTSIAAAVPAARATRIDPLQALREL